MTHRDSRGRGRTGLAAAFTAAVVGVSLAALPTTAAAAPAAPPPQTPDVGAELGKQDRDMLDVARSEGKRTVEIQVMADKGTAAELTAQGAKIRYRADDLGYLRAEVPIDAVEKMVKIPGVDALNVDRVIELDDPRPAGMDDPSPQPPPGADTPRVNPYMPTGDTGAAQFVERNPKLDGRGVTVGIVDTGVDLAHPSLNTTSTGEDKIVDWVTGTDPGFTNGVNNDDDPTWIDMSSPAPGQPDGYRYGVFDERDPRLGGELGNDVNRDGNPNGSIGTFGVLWDPATNTVWVDTNQNKSFDDETGMTDYKVKKDIGTFGEDDPSTPVAEEMPFVVQTSPETESVNIGIVSGAHGSHVAGIVAANEMFGGEMSGAAPGAKLVSVRACLFVTGCTAHALDEGMIYAARDANVDVINMSIGGLDLINDGQTVRELLYNELIETYDVQMFISAGNSGPGLNTLGSPSAASKVVSVGSYISKATWQRNYGSDAADEDNLHGFSSRGPREDGGFKPNIIAPGAAIAPIPTFMAGEPVGGTYELPPGYGMLNGTSMASPQSAGVAALLLSAAIQRDVEHSPAQLRQALISTARFIPGYAAFEQGNGLIDTNKAWKALRANIDTVDITSSVEVNTVLSDFLATPGVGTGIYDREGVTSGDRYTRDYTLTRTSGPAHPLTYKVRWVGNDGTFRSDNRVTLPLNSAVKFRVTVNPRSAGVHSAIMNLDSPTSTGIEFQTLNTVIAAEDFTESGGYQIRHGGEIGRNETESYFVRVPANTPALKVDLAGGGEADGAGQVRFLRFHPYGVGLENNTTPNCYNPPVPPANACDAGSPTSRTVTNPLPGVWEIAVEARRTSDAAFAPYTLTMSVLGATVEPSQDVIPSAQLGQPVEREYTLTNAFGQFNGRATGTPLGSALIDTPTIADGEEQQFPVTVAEGATELRAKIGNTADLGADLDLYVFDCTSGSCVQAGVTADGDSEEEVRIANPTPGQWVVLVFAYAVPAGETTYDYVDVFTSPSYGAIEIDDADADRPGGSSWTVTGTVTPGVVPADGRVLYGNVQVRTDADSLVGTGDVIIESVTS
ncbi:S8 family serine peptidase [Actinophytocola gossypii]|uniref:S8 family serine peptidase n=1 Tax=Actinophytocola gossypii TaxID=2812003 RepID=A0ABT2JHU7_9PSEU|nr:S8 family serine peptidase [Actinophytocola gossypii]MCT2587462.1 S8 family serine peptidase [Actinophytocola gossypii]